MTFEPDTQIFKALPSHLIPFEDGVIIKRGTLQTRVRGERALEVLQRLLERADRGASLDELRAEFPPEDRVAVDCLLDQLVARRLLVPVGDPEEDESRQETPEQIFFWEFGQDAEEVRARLRDVRIAVVGVNEISKELVRCLALGGIEQCHVVDYTLFRNTRLFHDDGELDADHWPAVETVALREWGEIVQGSGVDCVVATADHGGTHWMRQWNQMCVASGRAFFPVALRNLIGYIGPYVIPGETACFECLHARQNSNLSDPVAQRAAEAVAFESQAVMSFHPVMPCVVAQVAAMELIKVFSRALPFIHVGSLVEVDLLTPGLTTRKVLRIPSCPVCRSLQRQAPASASRTDSPAFGAWS